MANKRAKIHLDC